MYYDITVHTQLYIKYKLHVQYMHMRVAIIVSYVSLSPSMRHSSVVLNLPQRSLGEHSTLTVTLEEGAMWPCNGLILKHS